MLDGYRRGVGVESPSPWGRSTSAVCPEGRGTIAWRCAGKRPWADGARRALALTGAAKSVRGSMTGAAIALWSSPCQRECALPFLPMLRSCGVRACGVVGCVEMRSSPGAVAVLAKGGDSVVIQPHGRHGPSHPRLPSLAPRGGGAHQARQGWQRASRPSRLLRKQGQGPLLTRLRQTGQPPALKRRVDPCDTR